MSKFIGKIINSSRVLPTINTAGGIWNTIEQLQAQKTNTWPITEFKNIALPEITGTAIIGYTSLGCSTGIWSIDRNVVYAYQWKRNDIAISGATSNVYTLVSADGENILTCTVTITYTLTNESRVATTLPTAAIFIPIQDQVEYTIAGTYTWVCPPNVYNVSVVCIGGGGGGAYYVDTNPSIGLNGHINLQGAGGGGLGWKNNITVVPGQSYTVQVGAAGTASTFYAYAASSFIYPYTAGDSYFISNTTVCGKAGASGYSTLASGYTGTWPMEGAPGGGFVGDGGGMGGGGGYGVAIGNTNTSPPSGWGGRSGGGGTGGYSGSGGKGGAGMPNSATTNIAPGSEGNGSDADPNSGGGGGGSGDGRPSGYQYSGSIFVNYSRGSSGAGVGIYGKGTTGKGGIAATYNTSTGALITSGSKESFPTPGSGGVNKTYGAGGYVTYTTTSGSSTGVNGGGGAVRIIWPGNLRQFPTTRTTNENDILVSGVLLPTVTVNQGTAVSFKPVETVRGRQPYVYTISPSLPSGLSLNSTTGIISGTTTIYQLNTVYTITITDTIAQSSSKSFTLNCDYALDGTYTPIVTTVAVPTFSANQADEVSFTPVTATGGLTPYTFTTDRLLPADLVMNSSTGTVSGNTDYIYNQVLYKVIVQDSSNRTSSEYFTLSILPILPIVSGVVISNVITTIGINVNVIPVEVADGLAPYNYIIEPNLPTGLGIDKTTGAIKGVPTNITPTTVYTVNIVDSVGGTTSQTFSLSSVLVPISISYTTSGSGTILQRLRVYFTSEPILVSGGAKPYLYTISPSLPTGLSISSTTGIISGTPSILQATTTYTITITDIYNQTANTTITINIFVPELITTLLKPNITVSRGIFFQSNTLQITSGVGPYLYSIDPSLPTGININSNTGIISGIPTAGLPITSYTVTVTDYYSQASSKSLSLYVNPEGVTGQIAYIIPGAYELVVPTGVYSLSYVAIGAGCSGQRATDSISAVAGGGGGALSYRNNVSVTPGQTVFIIVGDKGDRPFSADKVHTPYNATASSVSVSTIETVAGGGTLGGSWESGLRSGTDSGTGGYYDGAGGVGGRQNTGASGGGGAGGYRGQGGSGAWSSTSPTGGTGGGGAGGARLTANGASGTGGGGVGLYGEGYSGTIFGGGGSGGGAGGNDSTGYYRGGLYGGGGGGVRPAAVAQTSSAGTGAGGAVRIIWPGSTRTFPSTNTMDM